MKIRKIKMDYIFITILAVGLLLIFASFFRQLNFADNTKQLQKGARVEIFTGDILEQRFISADNKLSNLKILFGNKTLKEGSSLKITLADKKCKKSIIEKTIKGEYEFDSKYLYDFNFPKIDDSKNKEYCLKIKLKTESEWTLLRKIKSKFKTEKKQGPQKIRLFEQIDKKDNTKNYTIKNESGKIKSEGQNKISFRQSYRGDTVISSFQQLNQRMSQYKPWFLKGIYLRMISCLVIILSLSAAGNIFLHRKNRKDL